VVFPGFKHFSLLAAAAVVVDLKVAVAVQVVLLKQLHRYLQVPLIR
jgi:hypothetical protein